MSRLSFQACGFAPQLQSRKAAASAAMRFHGNAFAIA